MRKVRRMTALLASLTQSQTPQSLRKNNVAIEVEAEAEVVTTSNTRTREGANTTEVNSGRTGAGHREDAAASGKTAMTRTGSSTSGVAFKTR
jgi:hypothetical protein